MNAVVIVPALLRDLCATILLEVSTATVPLAILEMGHIAMVSCGTTGYKNMYMLAVTTKY